MIQELPSISHSCDQSKNKTKNLVSTISCFVSFHSPFFYVICSPCFLFPSLHTSVLFYFSPFILSSFFTFFIINIPFFFRKFTLYLFISSLFFSFLIQSNSDSFIDLNWYNTKVLLHVTEMSNRNDLCVLLYENYSLLKLVREKISFLSIWETTDPLSCQITEIATLDNSIKTWLMRFENSTALWYYEIYYWAMITIIVFTCKFQSQQSWLGYP